MIKRRKDSGFTLIELMIVIAVIGILAIVLVPKVGVIKTQAKSAGIDTNERMVEGYIQSRISSWAQQGTDWDTIASDLKTQLTGASDSITNPFSGSKTITNAKNDSWSADAAVIINSSDVSQATTSVEGTIVVVPDSTVGPNSKIMIYAHDNTGKVLTDKTLTLNP